jgi:hypothetical protein
MLKRVLALAGALALGACGGDNNGPARIEVEDSWAGTISSGGASGSLSFTLTETDGAVTGSGSLVAGGDAVSLVVAGSYSPPTVSLTLTADGFESMNLTATVAEESMTGTLNGSGFVNTAFTLQRQ